MKDKSEAVTAVLQPESYENTSLCSNDVVSHSQACSVNQKDHNKPSEDDLSTGSISSDADETGTDSGLGNFDDTPLTDGNDTFAVINTDDDPADTEELQYYVIHDDSIEGLTDANESHEETDFNGASVVYVIAEGADISTEDAQDLALQVLSNGYISGEDAQIEMENSEVDSAADPMDFSDVVEVEIPYDDSPMNEFSPCASPLSDTFSRSSTPTDFLPPEVDEFPNENVEGKEASVVVEAISYDMPIIRKEILQRETSKDVFEPVPTTERLPFIENLPEESDILSKTGIRKPKPKAPKKKKPKKVEKGFNDAPIFKSEKIEDELMTEAGSGSKKQVPRTKPSHKLHKPKKIKTENDIDGKVGSDHGRADSGSPENRASNMHQIRAQHPVLSSMLKLASEENIKLENRESENEATNSTNSSAMKKLKKKNIKKNQEALKSSVNCKRKHSVSGNTTASIGSPKAASMSQDLKIPVWPLVSDGMSLQTVPTMNGAVHSSPFQQQVTEGPPKKKKKYDLYKCDQASLLNIFSSSSLTSWQDGLAWRLQEMARRYAERADSEAKDDSDSKVGMSMPTSHSVTILPPIESFPFVPSPGVSATNHSNSSTINNIPSATVKPSTTVSSSKTSSKSGHKKPQKKSAIACDPFSPASLAASLFTSLTQKQRNEMTLQQVVDACISDEMRGAVSKSMTASASHLAVPFTLSQKTAASQKRCESLSNSANSNTLTAQMPNLSQVKNTHEDHKVTSTLYTTSVHSDTKISANSPHSAAAAPASLSTFSCVPVSSVPQKHGSPIYTSSLMSRASPQLSQPLSVRMQGRPSSRPSIPPPVLPGPLPRPIPSINLAMINSPKKNEKSGVISCHAPLQPASSKLTMPASQNLPQPAAASLEGKASHADGTKLPHQQEMKDKRLHSMVPSSNAVAHNVTLYARHVTTASPSVPASLHYPRLGTVATGKPQAQVTVNTAKPPVSNAQPGPRPALPSDNSIPHRTHSQHPSNSQGKVSQPQSSSKALAVTAPSTASAAKSSPSDQFDNYTYQTLQMFLARNVPFRLPNTDPRHLYHQGAKAKRQPSVSHKSAPAMAASVGAPVLPPHQPQPPRPVTNTKSHPAKQNNATSEGKSEVHFIANWNIGQRFCCCYCPHACETGNLLFLHWMEQHNEDFRPYECPHCPLPGLHRTAIVKHLSAMHPNAMNTDIVVNRKEEDKAIQQFKEIFGVEIDRDQLVNTTDKAAFVKLGQKTSSATVSSVQSLSLSLPVRTAKQNAEVLSPVKSSAMSVTASRQPEKPHVPQKQVLPSVGTFQQSMFAHKAQTSATGTASNCGSPLKAYLMSRMHAAPGTALPRYEDVVSNQTLLGKGTVPVTSDSATSTVPSTTMMTTYPSQAWKDSPVPTPVHALNSPVSTKVSDVQKHSDKSLRQLVNKSSSVSNPFTLSSASKAPVSLQVTSASQQNSVDVNCNKAEAKERLSFKPATFVPSRPVPSNSRSSSSPLKANWQPLDRASKDTTLFSKHREKVSRDSKSSDHGRPKGTSSNFNDLGRNS